MVNTKFDVSHKTVLITGASGYLGRTMVEAFLSNGARVIALGKSTRLYEEARAWNRAHGENSFRAMRINLYERERAEKELSYIARTENINVVINNAHEMNELSGFGRDRGTLEGADFTTWMNNLTAGAFWPALTTSIFGHKMKTNGGGSIINISSMYAEVAPTPQLYEGLDSVNPVAYGAAKAAMLALTRYTASFWGQYNIRANALAVGPIPNTDLVDLESPFGRKLAGKTCLGRVGRPDDLVGPLIFLASDASSFVTGHTLAVDGGWTII